MRRLFPSIKAYKLPLVVSPSRLLRQGKAKVRRGKESQAMQSQTKQRNRQGKATQSCYRLGRRTKQRDKHDVNVLPPAPPQVLLSPNVRPCGACFQALKHINCRWPSLPPPIRARQGKARQSCYSLGGRKNNAMNTSTPCRRRPLIVS